MLGSEGPGAAGEGLCVWESDVLDRSLGELSGAGVNRGKVWGGEEGATPAKVSRSQVRAG